MIHWVIGSMNRPPITVVEDEEEGEPLEEGSLVLEYDGSYPLAKEKHEAMAQAIWKGMPGWEAYRTCISPNHDCSTKTAEVEYGKLKKENPDFQIRVNWLTTTEGEGLDEDEISRVEAVRLCSRLIRVAKNGVFKMQVLDRLTKLNQWDKTQPDKAGKVPDPVFFSSFIQKSKDKRKIVDPYAHEVVPVKSKSPIPHPT